MKTSSSPLRILLIDDSRGDALLIGKAIRQTMPEIERVDTAVSLADALRVLSQTQFDIALLDRSLPDVVDNSGLQSIQNMAPKLPVIFLTAYKNETAAVEAIEEGAQDYIFKDQIDGHAIKRAICYAIVRKRFENELAVQANYDRLTGLANRLFFEKRLAASLSRLRRYGGSLGLFFLDLNRFKPVNDAHGHAVGDRLLAETGKRLRACLRAADLPARFGGDEFALLIESASSREHCAALAQKLIMSLEAPFSTSGLELRIGVSIGIAVCAADALLSGAELMQCADAAMYEAKKTASSAYCFAKTPQNRQCVA
ncbi:MAG: GGDEF domain-containing response regulator [Alphaproteobacteria bacterium]|nr:GGDEF domain-containing response regulator [Alphaproteobacteria bacterium]